MMKMTRILLVAFAVAITSAADGLAAPRTFVSITGADTNACSQTSPCRTFAGALVKTNTSGEIIALDSGIYGNIQIDKSVTVLAAPGVHAAVGDDLKVGTPVTVTAPSNARVVLRNLYITARTLPQMARGIDFITGGALHIENCVIAGFKDVGIRFNGDLAYCDGGVCPRLFLKDSFVRGNGFPPIRRGSEAWRRAVAIADIARNDQWDSSVSDALYFHASRVSPGWRRERIAQVGNHVFYR